MDQEQTLAKNGNRSSKVYLEFYEAGILRSFLAMDDSSRWLTRYGGVAFDES